jgi:hypothetical protein
MPKRKRKFHKYRYETFVRKGLRIPKRILAKRRNEIEYQLAKFGYTRYRDRAGYTYELSWIVVIREMVEAGILEEILPRRDRTLRVFRRTFLPIETMHEVTGYDA